MVTVSMLALTGRHQLHTSTRVHHKLPGMSCSMRVWKATSLTTKTDTIAPAVFGIHLLSSSPPQLCCVSFELIVRRLRPSRTWPNRVCNGYCLFGVASFLPHAFADLDLIIFLQLPKLSHAEAKLIKKNPQEQKAQREAGQGAHSVHRVIAIVKRMRNTTIWDSSTRKLFVGIMSS